MNNTLQLTDAQRCQFDQDGFFLVEDALTPTEIEELTTVIDGMYAEFYRATQFGAA